MYIKPIPEHKPSSSHIVQKSLSLSNAHPVTSTATLAPSSLSLLALRPSGPAELRLSAPCSVSNGLPASTDGELRPERDLVCGGRGLAERGRGEAERDGRGETWESSTSTVSRER